MPVIYCRTASICESFRSTASFSIDTSFAGSLLQLPNLTETSSYHFGMETSATNSLSPPLLLSTASSSYAMPKSTVKPENDEYDNSTLSSLTVEKPNISMIHPTSFSSLLTTAQNKLSFSPTNLTSSNSLPTKTKATFPPSAIITSSKSDKSGSAVQPETVYKENTSAPSIVVSYSSSTDVSFSASDETSYIVQSPSTQIGAASYSSRSNNVNLTTPIGTFHPTALRSESTTPTTQQSINQHNTSTVLDVPYSTQTGKLTEKIRSLIAQHRSWQLVA